MIVHFILTIVWKWPCGLKRGFSWLLINLLIWIKGNHLFTLFNCCCLFPIVPQFVAHPNCQQLIAEVWYQGLPGWRRQHFTAKFLISVFVGISFPLLSLAYFLAPRTRVGQILRLPFLKFICHSASYLLFLVLLILASLDLNGESDRVDERAPPPSDIEILIVVWVLGKQLF